MYFTEYRGNMKHFIMSNKNYNKSHDTIIKIIVNYS